MNTLTYAIGVLLPFLSPQSKSAESDAWAPTEGWFTLHHDVQRSGRTKDSPGAPFQPVWHRTFFEGMISPETEPIVAEGLVFFGDWGGTFHALDAYSGKDAWTAKAPGGVRNAAAYDNGRIYFATLGDRAGGSVVCLKAKTGELLWEFKPGTRGGFATSPALYKGRVYLGGRDRTLYCLDAVTGAKAWTYTAGAPYLQSCALRGDAVYVAAEDMIPRCFDALGGKLLWEGAKMQSDSCRFYYPVFWRDTVIFRTCAPDSEINVCQDIIEKATEDGKLSREMREKYRWNKDHHAFIESKWKRYTPEKYAQEQETMREQIKAKVAMQTIYVLNVADGKEKMLTSVCYAGSENGYSTPTPGPVDFDGNFYVLYKTLYSQYEYPIRSFDCIGTLDYESGIPVMLPKETPGHGSALPITADEVNNFVVAGDKLIDTHDHVLSYYDLKTKKVVAGFSSHQTESWGGMMLCFLDSSGPLNPEVKSHPLLKLETPTTHLTINNEWNGTSRGSVAIYKDHVWWITGSMVVCLKGTSP
jgi:outer membrane protein assembly factor BamB